MRPQPPQLKWFKVTILKAGKKTEKSLLATDKDDAIKRGNKILKYLPGAGANARAVDAREDK